MSLSQRSGSKEMFIDCIAEEDLMTRFSSPFYKCRLLMFEALETRTLLTNGIDLVQIQQVYSDFVFENNAVVHEIDAEDLSVDALKSVIELATLSPEDDLVIVHTSDTNHTISFTTDSEFIIDIEGKGSLTIISWGTKDLTIDAAKQGRLFCVRSGFCQLGGLILANGLAKTNLLGQDSWYGMGGGLANAGNTTLVGVTVRGCSAESALFSTSETATSSFFSKGGGIYNEGTLTLCDSLLTGNIARSSGLDQINNTIKGAGGALFSQGGTVLIRDSRLNENSADAETIYYKVASGGDYIIKTTQQQGTGGAIYQTGGHLTIEGTKFCGNSAYLGGGVALYDGAIIELTDVCFEQNKAQDKGGALYCFENNGSIKIDNSDFFANVALNDGGAIYTRSATTTRNSAFSGNTAGNQGGAFAFIGKYKESVGVLSFQLINCTITGNRANTGGGGLYFSGMDSSKKAAELFLKNCILVKNRIENSLSNTDPNIALENTTDYCYGYYTLTSFNRWKLSSNNSVYSEDLPLFYRDYNFDLNTKGDYRLVYDSQSQAIDAGSNIQAANAGINTNSLDLAGKQRYWNDTIDIGAYEYQPTPFDTAFPTQLAVEQGCSFNLKCEGTDSLGNPITKYYVDLNNDGLFDKEGSSMWISWKELSERSDNKGYFGLMMENSLGEQSEMRSVSVKVIEVLPEIQTQLVNIYNDNIVKLCISVQYYDRSAKQWTIDWDDETTPTKYSGLSNSITAVHYYDPQEETKTYRLTLSLIDTNNKGGDITYCIGTHIISAVNSTPQTNNNYEVVSRASSLSAENMDFVQGKTSLLYSEINSETLNNDNLLLSVSLSDNYKKGFVFQRNNDSHRPAKSELLITRILTPQECQSMTAVELEGYATQFAALESLWDEENDFLNDFYSTLSDNKATMKTSLQSDLFENSDLGEILQSY